MLGLAKEPRRVVGKGTYCRQALTVLVQVSIGPPLIGRGREDAFVAILVQHAAPALQMWPQRSLSLSVDGDLRLDDADLLVRIPVWRYAC